VFLRHQKVTPLNPGQLSIINPRGFENEPPQFHRK
jgi:hypothetical protein